MYKTNLLLIILIVYGHVSNVDLPVTNILSSNNIEVNVTLTSTTP
ncbi:hypothetical protein RW71_04415 [Escherichia coli]|nr:hypothetical protein RW71_04415 [Escherichia coli]OXZ81337.1 hypothetical protein RW72_04485 [Escherichia coli]